MKPKPQRWAGRTCALLAAFLFYCHPVCADSPAPSPSRPSTNAVSSVAPKPKLKPKTFHGKITAWDPATMTITVSAWRKHVFIVNSDTKITRNNIPVTTDALAVGASLAGQYVKSEEGKLVAVSLHLKEKPESAPKWPEDPEAPETMPK